MRRPGLSACLLVGLLSLPGVAQAHLVNSGLGPFYDGALHLLVSPSDLLGLVALALLAGLRGHRTGRLTIIVLAITWLTGGMAGLALAITLDLEWLSIVSFLIPGVLVAANTRLQPAAVGSLGALYGLLHGFMNGSALAAIGAGPTSVLGIVLTVSVLALLISAIVVPLKAFWARMAVRVAGSWIVAVGILMLGWTMQGLA